MAWFDRILVAKTKFLSRIITMFGLGAGATWPGEIALTFRPNITKSLLSSFNNGIIIIAGTNGKTTTALMVTSILKKAGLRVVHNASGANLLNGIVSSCIRAANWTGKLEADWGVFEVDENSLSIVLESLKSVKSKVVVVLLNLFRDQLDRYGEIDVIVEKWQKALAVQKSVKSKVMSLVVNADDPGVASIGMNAKGNVTYFGLNDKTKFLKIREHATDSTFCPKCGNRLTYDGVYYSHIGIWYCNKCGLKRPNPDVFAYPSALPGLYNQYNTLAAVAASRTLGITQKNIDQSFSSFGPAFGRQEEVVIGGKTIKLFLSKNPTGFNASLRTAMEVGARNFLFVLNDRIPDGRDVSWIWDVDFEVLRSDKHLMKKRDACKIIVSGDRVWDMALRLKYADVPAVAEPDLKRAIALTHDTTYVLATYSAMLEVRKILTGRKIL